MIYFIWIIHLHIFHGNIWTQNWPAPNISGFIAQLVERRTGIARSRVQAPLKSWIFFRLLYAIAKIAIITARIILHFKYPIIDKEGMEFSCCNNLPQQQFKSCLQQLLLSWSYLFFNPSQEQRQLNSKLNYMYSPLHLCLNLSCWWCCCLPFWRMIKARKMHGVKMNQTPPESCYSMPHATTITGWLNLSTQGKVVKEILSKRRI